MLSNAFIAIHDGGVARLNGQEILVLHIHVHTELAVGGGGEETMQDVKHVGIALVATLVDVEHLAVESIHLGLVEEAQHLVEAVVDLTAQTGYLHDDAVVHQALHEGIGDALRHLVAVIVVRLVVDIEHGLLDVAHLVAKQIDRYHGDAVVHQSVLVLHDILGVGIVGAEVLTEAQRLSLEPRFLQFDEHEVVAAVCLAHTGSEVDAKHRNLVSATVGILMAAHIHLHHLLLEQGGEDGLGDTLVLHQVLKHDIVYRIGYVHHKAS